MRAEAAARLARTSPARGSFVPYRATDRNAALADLLAHADTHRDLIEEATRYQTSHGNFATDPFGDRREPADQPKPAKRTARTRKTEK
ncbi:hypothetical protein [Catellatospora chokoriensis]|uniref:hypothetical protein n=1 Tax=Catellatospora chokoriensis TaxID=310353 RepID=UPI001780AB97|nr:hypothetical protein [Catellatospora chokoriensis]